MEFEDKVPGAKLSGWLVQAMNRAGAPMPLMEVEASIMVDLIAEIQHARSIPKHALRKIEDDARQIRAYVKRLDIGPTTSEFADEYREADAWFKAFIGRSK